MDTTIYLTMYIIPCEYIIKNKVFRKLFNGDDIYLPKSIITHHCHKIRDNYHEKFKYNKF